MIRGLALVACLLLSFVWSGYSVADTQAWTTSSSKDEMSGEQSSFATSPVTLSTRPMAFPYNGTKAWLGVGCNMSIEWVFVGFTKAPNLNNTKLGDGYNVIEADIKWDNFLGYAVLTQKWGASFLHFNYDYTTDAIEKIVSFNTAMLELDWHGQQPVHFQFTLRGSSAAVAEIRRKCSKYSRRD
jgi:hypothetical protein